jgi:hypothetical protein
MKGLKINNVLLLIAMLFCSLPMSAQLNYSVTTVPGEKYKVILMAGQSNMVGIGKISDLENKNLPENIRFFDFTLSPDLSKTSGNFGPEVGVSRVLHQHFPDQHFILIKYAIGGSSLLDWAPDYDPEKAKITGFRQFGNMFATFQQQIGSVTEGLDAEIVALLWMQGERDARVPEAGKDYFQNFSKLIGAFREKTANPHLPVIFGQINPREDLYPALEVVRSAQLKIDSEIPETYLIKTDDLPKVDDRVHYNTAGQLLLGKRMGEKLVEVLNEK